MNFLLHSQHFTWTSIAEIVIIKIRTQKLILDTFFFLNSQKARGQNKSYRITEGYTFIYIEKYTTYWSWE